MATETITCTLTEGGSVIFDVTDTTADDLEETVTWYDVFAAAAGA